MILKNDNDHEDQWRAFIRRRLLIPWSSTTGKGFRPPWRDAGASRLNVIVGTNMGLPRFRRKALIGMIPKHDAELGG